MTSILPMVILVATTLAPGSPAPRTPFVFLDGGAPRALERIGAQPGSDRARVPGVLEDPITGRRAPVAIGSTVFVPAGADLTGLDVTVKERIGRFLLVESARAGEDAAELSERLSGVVDAYPNLSFRHRLRAIEIPPNDPRYEGQFYLEDIAIEDAWALSIGDAEIEILIIDNGCDLEHPDLVDKMSPGLDVVDGDDDPTYGNDLGNEHGTACAGLAAASTNNERDIAGACPECRLRCVRMLGDDGDLLPLDADVRAFTYALEQNVDIVSNSWGFVDQIPVPQPLKDAIIDVQQNGRDGLGAVVVFAAGNDAHEIRDDELVAIDGVLCVGAVNNLGELTQFTNSGRAVDVVAPTGAITTDISGPAGADPSDVTATFGGTSSACPIVAGLAGLIIARKPDVLSDEVNEALARTAKQSILASPDSAGHDPFFGFGLVQPADALLFVDPPGPDPERPGEGCGCSHLHAPSALLAALLVLMRRRRLRPA